MTHCIQYVCACVPIIPCMYIWEYEPTGSPPEANEMACMGWWAIFWGREERSAERVLRHVSAVQKCDNYYQVKGIKAVTCKEEASIRVTLSVEMARTILLPENCRLIWPRTAASPLHPDCCTHTQKITMIAIISLLFVSMRVRSSPFWFSKLSWLMCAHAVCWLPLCTYTHVTNMFMHRCRHLNTLITSVNKWSEIKVCSYWNPCCCIQTVLKWECILRHDLHILQVWYIVAHVDFGPLWLLYVPHLPTCAPTPVISLICPTW